MKVNHQIAPKSWRLCSMVCIFILLFVQAVAASPAPAHAQQGGCHIVEGNYQNGRLIQGTLTGKFTPATNSISNFNIKTSETITNNLDGEITGGTTTITVDGGSGGSTNDPSSPTSYQVTGRFTYTYQGFDGFSEKKAGKVTIPLDIFPIGPSIQLDRSEAARFSALKLSGSGFKKGDALKILFNGEEIFQVDAMPDGAIPKDT
jgi:hypothetical protein